MKKYYKYRNKKEKNILFQLVGNSSLFNLLTFVGLFSGGFLFLLYYIYIGFMPNLENLADFTYMIFAMTIVGMVSFLLCTVLLVFPGLFYNKVFDSSEKNIINTRLFILSIGVMPIVPLSFVLEELYFKTEYHIFTLLIFFIIMVWLWFKMPSKGKIIENMWLLLTLVATGVFPFLLFSAIILSKQSNINTNLGVLGAYFAYSVVTVLVNGFVVDKKQKLRVVFVIATSVLIFLMIQFRSYAMIPSFIMHKFKLGDFMAKSIVAKERSCQILLDAKRNALVTISPIDIKSKTCTIKGKICVLSNIGTHMLWKIEENITIKLPSEDFSGMIIDTLDKTRCITYSFDHNQSR